MTKLPKSRLAIAVAVVAVSVIGVAVVMLSGVGDETPPLVPDEAIANYDAFVSVSDVRFEMTALTPGEVPLSSHGILFVDVADGSQEFWKVPVEAGAGTPSIRYEVDRTHRWLLFEGGFGGEPLFLIGDRETGMSYRQREGWRIAYGPSPEGRLILQAGPDFVLLTLGEPEKTVRFYVPDVQVQSSAAPLGNGTHVVVSGAIVDVTTGEVSRFGAGAIPRQQHWSFGVGAGDAVAIESDPDGPEVVVRRFDSTGEMREVAREPRIKGNGFLPLPSPDGRWLAWQDSLPLANPPFIEFWPTVSLMDLQTGEVVFRALRASMQVALYDLQWLSDSSGVVVDSHVGFAVLTTQGTLQSLTEAPRRYAPVPASPYGMAIDGLLQLDDLRMQWTEPPESYYGRFTFGFNNSGTEVYLKKEGHFQADWLIFPLNVPNLPLLIQRPPFPDELRVRVATGGEGLNVRRAPGPSQERLGTLRDSSVVTVTDGTNEVYSQCVVRCSALRQVDGELTLESPWWIHLRSAEGLEGWVAAEYLTWAD